MSNVLISCHVNAQSLPAHYDEFLLYFQDNFHHLIAVSETWLKPFIPSSQVALPNYTLLRHDREDRTGGGVCLFVHGSLKSKLLFHSPSSDLPHLEYVFVEISTPSSLLLFSVVYRPPRVPFDPSFESLLYQLVPSYPHIIIAGDFNSNLLVESLDSSYLTDLFYSLNLFVVPYSPTHHTQSSDTWLDLFILDSQEKLLASSQHPVPFLSSHDLIRITFDLPVPLIAPKTFTFRDLNSLSFEKLESDLEALPYDSIFSSNTIDPMVDLLTTHLLSLLDSHAPLQSRRYRRIPAPWLTPQLKSLMHQREVARRKFRRTRLPDDFTRYKHLRNLTQSSIRRAKSLYIHQSLSSAPGSKAKWSLLRKLSLCKSNRPSSISFPPDVLNAHFVSSSSFISSNTQSLPALPFSPSNFFFSDITPEDLLSSVLKSQTNDYGPDGVPVKLIKACLPAILPVLLHIYNYSLQNSIFPSQWKSALVRPLNKIPNPCSPGDFRPISLLSNLSKPLERLVQSQLTNYLESNHLLSSLQSGFRPCHSTQSALLKITHDLQTAIDSQQLTILVLLDFSKAFDTVDHQILLSKLQSLSLSDSSIRWFQSFLSERSQYVVIPNSQPSNPLPLSRGVPQGSSLSPTLFSVYINDLPLSIVHSNYHLYADDSQIYLSFKPSDLREAVEMLQADLDSINAWAAANKLALNPAKTKAIVIGSQSLITSTAPFPTLFLNNIPIKYCTSVKNLGILFDSNLSWKNHISLISRRSIFILRQFNLSRCFLPTNTRQLLVTSLIFPHFDYGCLVYGGLSGDLEAKLKRLMNCFARFVLGIPRGSRISRFYHELNWLFPFYRRQYFLGSFLYQVIHSHSPSYIFQLLVFKSSVHSRNTRSRPSDLYTPSHRTALFEKSFVLRATTLWNSLPLSIRHATTLDTFKSRLFQHFLSLQISLNP